jgi:hypothetical protein
MRQTLWREELEGDPPTTIDELAELVTEQNARRRLALDRITAVVTELHEDHWPQWIRDLMDTTQRAVLSAEARRR